MSRLAYADAVKNAQRSTGCPRYLGISGCVQRTKTLSRLLRTSLAAVQCPQSPPRAACKSAVLSASPSASPELLLGGFAVTAIERVGELNEHLMGKGAFALDESVLFGVVGQPAVHVRLKRVQHHLFEHRVTRRGVDK